MLDLLLFLVLINVTKMVHAIIMTDLTRVTAKKILKVMALTNVIPLKNVTLILIQLAIFMS